MPIDHIKIGDVTPWVQYAGNGSQTEFDFAFPIFENADLKVYLGVSETPEASGYAIAGAGQSAGGRVTFLTPPENGMAVTLLRDVTIKRVTDFSESGDFRASAINNELDRLTAVAQQLSTLIGRAVRLADTDAAGAVQLPPAVERAGRVAAFDSAGNFVAAALNATQLLVSTVMEAVLVAPNSAAARAQLEAQMQSDGLDAIAALTPATGDALLWNGMAWSAGAPVSQSEVRRLALDVAALKGDRENMVDGIADPFADETDIDVGASTNAVYDAAGDFFEAALAYSADRFPTMTAAGTPSGTASASSSTAGNEPFRALDDSGATRWQANGETTTAFLKYDLGAGNGIVARQYTLDNTGVTDGARMPNAWVLEGSNNDSDWTALESQTGQSGWGGARIFQFGNAVSYRYYRLSVTAVNGGSTTEIGEWQIMTATRQNLLLTSEAFTADAQPDTALLHVQVVANEAFTINTDLIGRASRTDGADWTDAVLIQVGALADGTLLFEAGIDIAGQPAGTAMRYQIETDNTKDLEIHGVVLQWS